MARKGSLANWAEQFSQAEKDFGDAQAQIDRLENLYAQIVLDMQRFEKEIAQGPAVNAISDLLTALMGYALNALEEEFWRAENMTEGDIAPAMMGNLINVLHSKLIPSISYNSGKIEVDLIRDCNIYLGRVSTWFTIVKKARVTKAPTPEARMIGWRQIFDAAVKGFVHENYKGDEGKLVGDYGSIIAARLSIKNDVAPYWHFLEYGNDQRGRGVLYAYPSYGAPGAVSTAERRVREEGEQKLLEIEQVYATKRTAGWYKRRDILDSISDLIARLYQELEKEKLERDIAEAARRVRGIVTREVKSRIFEFQGEESLEKLAMDDIHEIRNKVIHRIANWQTFGIERIIHKGFRMRTRSLRIDVEEYLRNVGFGDITIRDVFY